MLCFADFSKTILRTFQFQFTFARLLFLYGKWALISRLKFIRCAECRIHNCKQQIVDVFDFVWRTKTAIERQNMRFEICVPFDVDGYRVHVSFSLCISLSLPLTRSLQLAHIRSSVAVHRVCGSIVAAVYLLRRTHLFADDCGNTRETRENQFCFIVDSTVSVSIFDVGTQCSRCSRGTRKFSVQSEIQWR